MRSRKQPTVTENAITVEIVVMAIDQSALMEVHQPKMKVWTITFRQFIDCN